MPKNIGLVSLWCMQDYRRVGSDAVCRTWNRGNAELLLRWSRSYGATPQVRYCGEHETEVICEGHLKVHLTWREWSTGKCTSTVYGARCGSL